MRVMTRAHFNLTLKAQAAKDGDEMLVFGLMSCSVGEDGTRVVDSHDDVITIKELEKGAYGYVANTRGVGVEHAKFNGIGRLIESTVFTPEKLEKMGKMGIQISSSPQAWWVGYKVDDPKVWERVKSGELSEFSWGGWAKRGVLATEKRKALEAVGIAKNKAGDGNGDLFELTDLEIEEGSLVSAGANPKAKVAFFKRAGPLAVYWAKTKAALAALVKMEDAPPSTDDVLAQAAWCEQWWKLRDAFESSIYQIMEAGLSAQECAARLQDSTQQFLDGLTALNAGAASKALDPARVDDLLSEVLASGVTTALRDDVKKILNVLEQESGAPVRAQKEFQMPKTAAEIMKSLSADDRAVMEAEAKKAHAPGEEVLTRLAKAEADVATAKKDAEAAQKAADASAAELLVQKNANLLIQKEALVKDLIVPTMDHKVLADTLFKNHGQSIHDILLASWRETTKQLEPLLSAPGSAARASADTPAQAELAKAMEVHVKAGLNDDAARSKAMQDNPALAKRVLAEMRNGAN